MPTILVADDNSNIQKMVSLVFKEKGIRVVAVGNGEAACRKVPEVHPDVVLADVFMPVRNGYEVCEFVKHDPQFAETPVILLVGAFDPLDEKEAQRVGANGVLKKPFVPAEPLIAMVNSLLKIEPPAEVPQSAQTTEDSLTPQSPEESGPSARQIAIALAQAKYAAVETDETVTTFSAPVATPSTEAHEAETEDDSEPASEWARRRATMDYEIPTADSANMVEKLAAEKAVEEPEILASTKHLPFGGANVPEGLSETRPESSLAKWPDLMASEVTPVEPSKEKREQKTASEEVAEPSIAPSSLDSLSQPESDSTRATDFGSPSPASDEMPARTPDDMASAQATRSPSTGLSGDAVHEVASASWPLPEAPRESEARFIQPQSPDESTEPRAALPLPEDRPVWQEAAEKMLEPPLALPEAKSEGMDAHPGKPVENLPELGASTEETTSKPPVDQATVDDMVAKVLSKLEPQLHQALANGVLRPLVEELLNQDRDKK